MGSADLMPRNLDSRVELAAPVEDPEARAETLDALERCLADDASSWTLDCEGRWSRSRAPSGERRDVQAELRERCAARAAEQLPAAAG